VKFLRLENKFSALVVDDEQQICDMVKIFLTFSGLFENVVTANDVIVAKQKLSNQKFDLIIIDNILPKRGGLDLVDYINNYSRNANYQKTRIILISGVLKAEDVISATRYGIKHILVKPFTNQKLIAAACDILGISTPNKDSEL